MYYNEEDRDMLIAKLLVYSFTSVIVIAITITLVLLLLN